MCAWITETAPVSEARAFWEFYRRYTHPAIHVASAAALAIFGLLVFVDPLFAGLAIAAYVCPPLVLYLLDVDVTVESDESTLTTTDKTPQSKLVWNPILRPSHNAATEIQMTETLTLIAIAGKRIQIPTRTK